MLQLEKNLINKILCAKDRSTSAFYGALPFFDLRQAKKDRFMDVNFFTQLEVNRLGTQLGSGGGDLEVGLISKQST